MAVNPFLREGIYKNDCVRVDVESDTLRMIQLEILDYMSVQSRDIYKVILYLEYWIS